MSAPPLISVYGRAPRAAAWAADSTTKTTAPSPKTKPSRSASNGRPARSGASLRVESAPMVLSPVNITGVMAESVPPATTTSASPARTVRRASSRAWMPLAQARAEALTGPCVARSMATSQAGMFGMTEETK